jgi:3-oxo-4,17-pregnadiene-20-carboxyl-CoA hydratase alpha subunit
MTTVDKHLPSETDKAAFLARLKAYEGRQIGPPEPGPDAVNQAMIRHWCEAIGDELPIYTDAEAARASVHGEIVAPPVMLQAWTMRGIKGRPPSGGTAQDELMRLLESAGFTSVVATNCEQEYVRYLHLGDRLSVTSTIESVSDEKTTGLGAGHFVTTRQTYTDADGAVVATMLFRILRFRPAAVAPPTARPPRPRPAVTHDNAFWFEGAKQGRLLIQRCTACGQLRHPPGPMCPACRSSEWDTVEASGRGTVYSFVVNHYPQVPAFDYPLVVALVELEEGTRLVADLVGVAPSEVRVGIAVQAEFVEFDRDLTLPVFRPVGGR